MGSDSRKLEARERGTASLGIQRSMVQRILPLLGALNLRLPFIPPLATRDES